MRIGVFGGSFDPVHWGHLILAEQCREQASLDQVWFIPAARPPHKRRQLTPFEQRVEMLRLAISGNSSFRVDQIENERTGPSYTVDTIAELKRRHPHAQWLLLLGADMLADLPQWYQPQRILELAHLLIAARPGWEISAEETLRSELGLKEQNTSKYQRIDIPLIGLSSSDIRRRVAQGRSIRYLVPRAVEAYIQDKRPYSGLGDAM